MSAEQTATHRVRWRTALALAGLTIFAVLVHGYHPAVEDAEIYLPGILQRVHPDLFPHNAVFFQSHARLTLFPDLMAGSMRLLPVPPMVVLLLWHVTSIFVLLWACWRVGMAVLPSARSAWGGVALVAVLLTLPVAGTDLYIMDQYLTPRSFSTPLSLLAVACLLEGRPVWAVVCLAAIAPIHPLMSVFAAALLVALVLAQRLTTVGRSEAVAIPAFFPPVTAAYRRVLETRPGFFITRWAWYEWIGLVAPLLIFVGFLHLARARGLAALATLCRAVLLFESAFLLLALIVSRPGVFERFAELQPMRSLQLVYIVMFLVGGGLLGEYVLRRRVWRWVALFVPISVVMLAAQVRLFPATRHLELPGLEPRNPWVRTFRWVRAHTPRDAYFALDPRYLVAPGEDEHGFRAIAERSRLADAMKDSGVASMFPEVSAEWAAQVDALGGWPRFTAKDFARLRREFGVDWVVTSGPVHGLVCVHREGPLAVCRIPG
jgi:hypothetical protein